MNELFQAAAKISSMWSLAAFAIAAVIFFAIRGGRGKVNPHIDQQFVCQDWERELCHKHQRREGRSNGSRSRICFTSTACRGRLPNVGQRHRKQPAH